MKLNRLFLLLILSAVVLVPASALLKVTFVDGEADYRGEGDTVWKVLEEGQSLPESGYVRTGKDSALELVKSSKLRMVFSSNTLAKLKLDGDPAQDRLLLHAGTILAEVIAQGAPFQVRTETADMGVRGTQFSVETAPGVGTQVAVRKGRVYTLGRTPDNEPVGGVLVEAGQKTSEDGKSKPVAKTLGALDGKYFDFDAFDKISSGEMKDVELFNHYAQRQDELFKEFKEQDLADYQLFVLDDLDRQWEFLLSENQDYAAQLKSAPLQGKE